MRSRCIGSMLLLLLLTMHAWVNDVGTQRAYESSEDAYQVFRKMLKSGHPPDNWGQLLAEARTEEQGLQRFGPGMGPQGV